MLDAGGNHFPALAFRTIAVIGIAGAAIARTATLILGNAINVFANRALLKVFPYTLKHAALVAAGVAILAIRYGLLPHHPGLPAQPLRRRQIRMPSGGNIFFGPLG